MAKSSLSIDLDLAVLALMRFAPYSTSPDFRSWISAMRSLKDVQAALTLADAYRPMCLDELVRAAYEEYEVRHRDPPPEITALIARYSSKREPLR